MFVVVTVCDLLQLCRFTADSFDENTFLQMSQLSETISGKVSEHSRLQDMGSKSSNTLKCIEIQILLRDSNTNTITFKYKCIEIQTH